MSEDRLAEIKRRRAEITPGKWTYSTAYGLATIETLDREAVAHAVEYLKTKDADFIADAPADIDWLVGEVESLRDQHRHAMQLIRDLSNDLTTEGSDAYEEGFRDGLEQARGG